MTTAATAYADPRSRSAKGWRASLGAMASRGEVNGPRVEQAKAALSWWRTREFLVSEFSEERADVLLDLIYPTDETSAAVAP